MHFRILLREGLHHLGQRIARLGVGGGDGETAAVMGGEFLADTFEAIHFLHDQLDRAQHRAARLGQAANTLAVAREDVHAQLLLQLDDGLGDPGLRGIQGLGGLREVEVLPYRFTNETELMKIHEGIPSLLPGMAAHRACLAGLTGLTCLVWRISICQRRI